MLKYDISPKAKGLIFDLDGTLANTMPFHYEAWRKAAADYGIEMSKNFLKSEMGSSGMSIAIKLLKIHAKEHLVKPSEIIEVKNEYFKKLMHKVTPIDEVFEIAKKYHGKMPMSIGTGGNIHTVTQTLEHTGIGGYFNILVSAEDVENHKPAPDTFLLCAERMGIHPSKCEVFEDGELGLEAAEKAGMISTDVRSWFEPKW
jgi:beta-phosphoglucomutase family hydrolase